MLQPPGLNEGAELRTFLTSAEANMITTDHAPPEPNRPFYRIAWKAAKATYELKINGRYGTMSISTSYFVLFDCVNSDRRLRRQLSLVQRLHRLGHKPIAVASFPHGGPEDGLCQALLFKGDSDAERLVLATWEAVLATENKE